MGKQRLDSVALNKYDGLYTSCKCHRVTPLGFQKWTSFGWVGVDSVIPCDLKIGEDPREEKIRKQIEKREQEKDIRCQCAMCLELWK